MSSKILRRALNHYGALVAEMREQELAEAADRLSRIAQLNSALEQEQVADKLRRYGMVVR